MDDYSDLTNSTCILCHQAPGEGQWRLCPTCRRELAERSRRRQARMAPQVCLGCFALRKDPPMLGSIYCPWCQRRFGR
jgi:hypothetical protein